VPTAEKTPQSVGGWNSIRGNGTQGDPGVTRKTTNTQIERTEPTMAKELFMRVDEVAKEMGVSNSYAYKVIKAMNKKLEKTGCITLNGRIDRKFFYDQFYGTRNEPNKEE